MAYAQIYKVESRSRMTVSVEKLYEVPRDNDSVRIPVDTSAIDSEKRYFFEDGDFLHRIFILQTAESEDHLLRSIDNAEKGPRRTVRVPKRKSLGELKIAISNFQHDQLPPSDKDKSAVVKVVKTARINSVLDKLKACNMTKSKKKRETKKDADRDKSETTLNKAIKVGAQNAKGSTGSDGNKGSDANGSKTEVEGGHHQDTASVTEMNQKAAFGKTTSGDKKFDRFKQSVKLSASTSSPVKLNDNEKRRKIDHCENCVLLEDKVTTLEAENTDLKNQVKQQSEQHNMILQMNNNLQNLCSALTKEASNNKDEKDKKKSSTCKIKLTSNITDEEGVEVSPAQIYIGKGLFIEKNGLTAVELKKPRNFKTRMEGVVKLVWPDGDAKDFNLAGSDGKKTVMEYQVNAVHKLLNLLSWKNIIIKPLKVNKKMVEPLTFEHVKRKLGIHLSEINPKVEIKDKKAGQKKVNKDNKKEPDQSDTINLSGSELDPIDDDEEVAPKKKKKKTSILDDTTDTTDDIIKIKAEPIWDESTDDATDLTL